MVWKLNSYEDKSTRHNSKSTEFKGLKCKDVEIKELKYKDTEI